MSSYDEHQEWLYRQYQAATTEEQPLWVAEIIGHSSAISTADDAVPYHSRAMGMRYTLGRNDGKTQLLIDRKETHENETATSTM